MPVKVLCLGGGYTAVTLAWGLKRAIKRGDCELTIVSRDNFHTFHGFVHEMLTGKVPPGQIISPARRIFPPAIFHNAEIEAIDLENRKVTVGRLLDGKQSVLTFDHVVFALGSTDDLSRYAGIAEHAQKLKTYWDCFKTRNHLISMLEMAEVETDPEERKRLLTFVVAGGGYGGVEVSTELQHFLQTIVRKEYSRIAPDEPRVVLVHSTARILPELHNHHEPLVAWAEKFIATSGIDLKPRTKVAAATAEEIVLDSGEKIQTRTIISCTGTAQSPLLDKLDLPRDDRGRIMTDEHLRVRGEVDIWAGGDCASVPHPKGGICPPLGIYALTAGRQIAKNIKRAIYQRQPKPYRFTGLGDACALGRRRAVAHVRGFRLKGFIAWVAWRSLLLMFVPSWDRKVRLVADWLIWPFVGRDIVNMKVDQHMGVQREHFEPGQIIMRQGDVGQRMFLLWKGEAEVLLDGENGTQRVKVIKEGDHFGETSTLQGVRRIATVKALTPVEVLAIGRAEALALAEIAPAFGEKVRRPLVSLETPRDSQSANQPDYFL
jgi:NADH dehydrogenase